DLAQLQVRPVSDWGESHKLKNEIAEPQYREGDPDALVAAETVKTVTERASHRDKKHHQRIPTAQPQPAVNAWRGLPPLSNDWSGSNGVLEQRSNASQNVTPTLHCSITPSLA